MDSDVTLAPMPCTDLVDMLPTHKTMKRFSLIRCALPLLVLTLAMPSLPSCGGAPDSARTAQRHLVRGDYEAASAAADRSIEKHPKDPTSWRVRIRSAMAQGELALAAQHYQEWKTLRGDHDRTTYRLMAVSTLWQGMQVPAPEIKARTIGLVARHNVEKLASEVRDALGDDSDLVAASAAVALMRSHPAAPHLATELLQSGSAKVRALVVTGIGKKIGRKALGDLVPALTDADPIVRRAAVSAIASWKHKKDSARLMAMAKSDSDGQVRSRALRGLLAKGGDGVVALAQASLDDAYPGAQLAGLALLEKFSEPDAVARARELVASKNVGLAMRSAVILHKHEGTPQNAVIANAFASADWASRSAAMNTAAEVMSDVDAMAIAKRGLADVHEDVRIAAARLLIRLGDVEQGRSALTAALASNQLGPRLAAATELARLDDANAIALLGQLARSGNADQRKAALAAHKAAQVLSDGLVAALGDENIDVRLAAADALLAR